MLYGWLRTKQKSKNRSAHTAQPKTSESAIMFFWKKKMDIYPTLRNTLSNIPDFGVKTVILNRYHRDFRRWCKLNFGPLRGKVKSRNCP